MLAENELFLSPRQPWLLAENNIFPHKEAAVVGRIQHRRLALTDMPFGPDS